MEFLLQSEQRNRSWVNLKQWLLLAARVLLVALTALMVARPQLVSSLASWLTAQRVHHVIVLDDSFSMSDAAAAGAGDDPGSGSAWQNAQRVVRHIVQAAIDGGEHRVSIFRTSQVGLDQSDVEPESARGRSELEALSQRVANWKPSFAAPELVPAIAAAARYSESLGPAVPVVGYVVSDCRTKNLQPVDPVVTALAELAGHASATHLVPTSTAHHANLAVSELKLLPGAKTARLELTAQVSVTNYGPRMANRVTVKLAGDSGNLPAAEIGDIPPGETASRTFPVRFGEAGQHTLTALLDADAVAADNQRYLAIDLPDQREVLIVDGSEGARESLAYAAALKPLTTGATLNTGLEPVIGDISDVAQVETLKDYAAVLLLDCREIPASVWASLKSFYESGGGVFLSVGKEAEHRSYNRAGLAGAANPLLPLELGVTTQAPPDTADPLSDLTPAEHPLFKVFTGDRNSFLDLIAINYYRSVTNLDRTKIAVLASLRGKAPLLIERTDGPGKALMLLTTTARPADANAGWTNLSLSPVFPVIVNELVAHLAAPRLADRPMKVQDRWTAGHAADNLSVQNLDGSPLDRSSSMADLPGLFKLASNTPATDADGLPLTVAVNVEPTEGNLALPTSAELRREFAGNGVRVTPVSELLRQDEDSAAASIYRLLGIGILTLLLLEQLLAVACSYHQPVHDRTAGVAR